MSGSLFSQEKQYHYTTSSIFNKHKTSLNSEFSLHIATPSPPSSTSQLAPVRLHGTAFNDIQLYSKVRQSDGCRIVCLGSGQYLEKPVSLYTVKYETSNASASTIYIHSSHTLITKYKLFAYIVVTHAWPFNFNLTCCHWQCRCKAPRHYEYM